MTTATVSRSGQWAAVLRNPSCRTGALTEQEGLAFRWHSHAYSDRSSQVFCVSAFGSVRSLPDGGDIISALLSEAFPQLGLGERWSLALEHENAELLGERDQQPSQPTSIDVLARRQGDVVCVESKFVTDAEAGFGGCSQVRQSKSKPASCAGFYGVGSDLKTRSEAHCRLTVSDGHRAPRLYWDLGRTYFRPELFVPQTLGQSCPLAGPNFQLMRNFLVAAGTAAPSSWFGVLAIAPANRSAKIVAQARAFISGVLQARFADRIGVASYDRLVELLDASPHSESRSLASFLRTRMSAVR
jgi:hypothetical protein